MPNRGTESDFELATIERLEALGYQHVFGFDLDRPQTFHRGLGEALRNPERSEAMAARGAEKVRTEYSLASLASRMKSLYEQLIEEKACAT